ncbi:MAG: ISAs1 family transposase [Eubacterium sp.]
MENIREKFSQIEDKRNESYIEHNLVDILILVMGAVVSGITELADMMVYFASKRDFYKEQYGIEKYPSKPTLSRVLNMIDADAVGKMLVQIMCENAEDIGNIIAVDGKAIRSTRKKGQSHSFLQILTAYATESGITLSQSAISYEDKTNEIPVFQSMLDCLDIKEKIITADAMHCQKDTCAKIIKNKGHYIFGLKGNQGNLSEEVRLFFEDSINDTEITTFQTLEKNGGRIEKRVCRATSNVQWLADLPQWAGLQTIFSVTRSITTKEKTTKEVGYYISSLDSDPEKLLGASRSHWKIESMHWMLDVIWNEDTSGILSENGNKTINSFRKLALLAHKRYISSLKKKTSVKSNVLSALLNDAILVQVLKSL